MLNLAQNPFIEAAPILYKIIVYCYWDTVLMIWYMINPYNHYVDWNQYGYLGSFYKLRPGEFSGKRRNLTHLPLDKTAVDLADSIFKCIFLNEKFRISIRISPKLVLRSPINNRPALV